ncbi:AB hydrolase-1 domain-containing protein [Citrus sinensis]|uniref:AB hydrolase-1 domain-containing protein n=2 Tax=Citrus TaxID=2706 RepID=V4VAG2_CITCL|nr:uncharacterized protein LOC102624347 [Citrus sinensis]XP_024041614.1 abhydrolase domain-containing protein abhd-5.2 [Citrus x clementina]ESR49214.1 hypothetical protein CICLE_v10031346mg [Citrus x clementina]KAH9702995.1 AB hydrolase-1 domain-containing protein [Citrus sinensis]GAY53904.1 hypothetical protein CUMW_152550 [Citrus unshiu]
MGVAVNSDFFKFTYEFRRHNLKQLDKNKPRVSCIASSSISKKIKRTTTITTHAAASSSPAPGAHYPEQLLDVKTKQKRKRIAGIDQDELVDPKLLADPDSCFCEFNGVHLHYKVYDAESQSHNSLQSQTASQLPPATKKIGFPMILFHGFGASVFSWNRAMKPLAKTTSSKVLAFDRPAFGLTSRVFPFQQPTPDTENKKPLNPYSMAFSVLATLYFIHILAAEKAILVGHSAGALVAVNSYFEAPERVAALILIAPAILAPRLIQKVDEGNPLGRNEQTERDTSNLVNLLKPFLKVYTILSMFLKYITQAMMQVAKGMADMLHSLYKKVLSATLRSAVGVTLVRILIDKFGLAAVRRAWYNSKEVAEHVIEGYTKPLRVKGWDRALVEFTAALLIDNESKMNPPLAKRLHEISCPVLIVTGDTDRIVPSWNAERLSRAIPGSTFEVIKNCGHVPQEEKVEEFVSIVARFLQRAFGYSESEGKSMQAVS